MVFVCIYIYIISIFDYSARTIFIVISWQCIVHCKSYRIRYVRFKWRKLDLWLESRTPIPFEGKSNWCQERAKILHYILCMYFFFFFFGKKIHFDSSFKKKKKRINRSVIRTNGREIGTIKRFIDLERIRLWNWEITWNCIFLSNAKNHE